VRFVLSPDSRQAGGSDRNELRDAAPDALLRRPQQ